MCWFQYLTSFFNLARSSLSVATLWWVRSLNLSLSFDFIFSVPSAALDWLMLEDICNPTVGGRQAMHSSNRTYTFKLLSLSQVQAQKMRPFLFWWVGGGQTAWVLCSFSWTYREKAFPSPCPILASSWGLGCLFTACISSGSMEWY